MSTQTQQTISTTRDRIIIILEEQDGGELRGTDQLAGALSLMCNKTYVIKSARRLADSGEITICRSCGGRGKKTVYKRNRNQPGLARKANQ